MAFIRTWTGRHACALQAALRLSNEAFAAHLGVAVRTVATWHQKPDITPRSEMQQALDTALEKAPETAKDRFAALVDSQTGQPPPDEPAAPGAQALTVAVAVVLRDPSDVLLVCRRGDDGRGISWQFPAGVIKPGASPETTALRETLGETGVHAAAVRRLGSRLHPITNVMCDYVLCDYLGGEAENKDVAENVSVTWTPTDRLIRYIPADRIYPPILEALEIDP